MPTEFDYIITGAGASGLSLLVHLIKSCQFSHKKILLLEKSPKINNDRTWCFWETESGIFEDIVYRRWEKLWFYGNGSHAELNDISPYQYKLIRGIDYYHYCFELIKTSTNITVQYGDVQNIVSDKSGTYVLFNNEKIYCEYIFNSILFNPPVLKKKEYYLLQHFKGWIIKTVEPVFDPEEAVLMDFRVPQDNGTTFVYVMPFSANEALVEYTLFSDKILSAEEYDMGLKNYIGHYLYTDEYEVVSEEFGVIPMTNHHFPSQIKNIINIGTAGGNTKASSGYTFQFIQKNSRQITEALIKTGKPYINRSFIKKRFDLYDATLLNILHYNKLSGSDIFTTLMKNNSMSQVFKFLDNETSITEELLLIRHLPWRTFMNAALQQILPIPSVGGVDAAVR
jgi:lycopene beta-cyclase